MTKSIIRNYFDGDEHVLAKLHQKTWGRFSGFVTKTADQWLQLYVKHPDIGPNRIVVAVNKKGIAGYAAWSCRCHPLFPRTDADGMIYDICLADHGTKEVVEALVRRCIIDAEENNAFRLACFAPASDARVRSGLYKWGFVDRKKGFVMGFLVTDANRMLNSYAAHAVANGHRIRALDIELVQDFSDRIVPFGENGVLRVNVSGHGKPIQIRIGIVALTIMMMGGDSIFGMFVKGLWSVKHITDIPAALSTLKELSPGLQFAMPLIDWR
jgi:hypothetical protein